MLAVLSIRFGGRGRAEEQKKGSKAILDRFAPHGLWTVLARSVDLPRSPEALHRHHSDADHGGLVVWSNISSACHQLHHSAEAC